MFRTAVLLIGLLLVASQLALSWAAWRRDVSPPWPVNMPAAGLISVTLVNGQVYYGNLASMDARQITLEDVYYVQTSVDGATNQRSNRLVSRKKTDWHAPLRMTVPADKVVLIEQVGIDSQLVRLIEQDKNTAPVKLP